MKIEMTTMPIPPGEMADIAKIAEQAGVHRMWIGEHVVVPRNFSTPYPYKAQIVTEQAQYFDLWSMVGNVLGATATMQIGTGVAVLPFRHPLVTARAAITAQLMSGGRFTLGAGSGWLQEEFEVLDIPFRRRGNRMDETLDIITRACKGGYFKFTGDFFAFPEVMVASESVDLPLVFGGDKERPLRRAASRGDGWYGTSSCTLSDCVRIRDQLKQWRHENGRSERPFTCHVRVQGAITLRNIQRYLDEGFDNLILPWTSIAELGPEDPEGRKLAIKRMAQELGMTVEVKSAG